MRSIVFLLIILFISPVAAQEVSLTPRQSEDGVITISLPDEWVLQGGYDRGQDVFFAAAASDDNLDIWNLDIAPPGSQGLIVFGGHSAALAAMSGVSFDPSLSSIQLVEALIPVLSGSSDQAFTIGEPEAVTLPDGTDAGRVFIKDETTDGMLLAFRKGDTLIIAIAAAYVGELADFEPLALSIIQSIAVELPALPEPEPLPEIVLTPVTDPRRVIIDADMAFEDMFAILYLLKHPAVEVVAVTVSATGEAHCEGGVRSALALLVISGSEGIPVSCGSETPLGGDHEFPAEWRAGADSAYGIALPDISQRQDARDAAQLILHLVSDSPDPTAIVAVGPLTNIAEAIQRDPAAMTSVQNITIMGGAVRERGNVMLDDTTLRPSAEWNIYIDPLAANIVLQSGIPITMVPLDATVNVPITSAYLRVLRNGGTSPEARFVVDMLSTNAFFVDSPGTQFWDTLTAAAFSDERVAQFEEISLRVIEGEGVNSGRTVIDSDGPSVRVAVFADRAYFEALFLAVLNH